MIKGNKKLKQPLSPSSSSEELHTIRRVKSMVYRYNFIRLPYLFFRAIKSEGMKKAVNKVVEKYHYTITHKKEEREFARRKQNLIQNQQLKVSVIVPNYNHEKYIRKRLDSIYSQTYKNYEVILLDDASTDGSVGILEHYSRINSHNTRLIKNELNSGGVFRQWKKGISVATGDLCWIAESDDFADDNFLEALVAFFQDEAVMLAYSHMVFCSEGKPAHFSYEKYLAPLGNKRWKKSYVCTANQAMEWGLAIKNVIPNASGAVFRRPQSMPLLNDPEFLSMKVCGDWLFYIHMIAGGKIAYSSQTNNYFNLHEDSSSKVMHVQSGYYKEHEKIASVIASLYPSCEQELEKNYEIIHSYYFQTVKNPKENEFRQLYDSAKVQACKQKRKPSILISLYSFSLGGGEIFPIRLSNQLKKLGYPVTLHCMKRIPYQPEIRSMLYSDIPVVYAETINDIKDLLKKFKFDVINTHHVSNQHLFADVRLNYPDLFRNTAVVSTTHGGYEAFDKSYIRDCLPLIDYSTDIWTRVADNNLGPFYDLGIYKADKHVLIPNGIDAPTNFKVTRSGLKISNDAFVLCLASRAIPEKGWEEAIEAVGIARKKSQKEICLLLLGEGEIYNSLKQLRLPEYIFLLGLVSNTIEYYQISNMGILPSYFLGESMPLSIIEAFSVGKPVIASDVGQIRQLLSCENGFAGEIFELKNGKIPIETVGNIIASFVLNTEKYTRAQANAEKKKRDFSIQNTTQLYLDVYKKVIPAPKQEIF